MDHEGHGGRAGGSGESAAEGGKVRSSAPFSAEKVRPAAPFLPAAMVRMASLPDATNSARTYWTRRRLVAAVVSALLARERQPLYASASNVLA